MLVTHDHLDHNGVEAIGGEPAVLDKPGTHESPVGEVVGIASEHDTVAGTQRGPNTIFRFTLDGTTVAHFGDFGQPALRPSSARRSETSTCSSSRSAAARRSRWTMPSRSCASSSRALVVAMHYRTPGGLDFLDPPDAFLEAMGARVERLETSETDVEPLLGSREEPVVALLAPPVRDE